MWWLVDRLDESLSRALRPMARRLAAVNLLDLFEIRRRDRPEAVALSVEDGREWSYEGPLTAAGEVATGRLSETWHRS